MGKREFEFLIDLPVENHWENVDLLRTSVLNCLTAMFREIEGVETLATIAAELLENAIKYGRWPDDGKQVPRLHLRIWGDRERARVEVAHPADEGSNDVVELLKTIAWLKTFSSPEEAYRARLLEVATSPRGVSKLGLARISYEGKCTLDASIGNGVLRVTSSSQM
jgi:hypothetical protein